MLWLVNHMIDNRNWSQSHHWDYVFCLTFTDHQLTQYIGQMAIKMVVYAYNSLQSMKPCCSANAGRFDIQTRCNCGRWQTVSRACTKTMHVKCLYNMCMQCCNKNDVNKTNECELRTKKDDYWTASIWPEIPIWWLNYCCCCRCIYELYVFSH